MKEIFKGVWKENGYLLTKNLVEGKSLTEKIIRRDGAEFRVWDPSRSKIAAAVMKGMKSFPIRKNSKILYLGISSGSTSSYFSDIIGYNGVIYGVEISERSLRDLNPVAEKRGNIVPILANAKTPEEYSWIERPEMIYQDVAASDQSEILIRNAKKFLSKGDIAMIAIKSRSIDVTKSPRTIYKREMEKLSKHFNIIESIILDPYEKDHIFLVLRVL